MSDFPFSISKSSGSGAADDAPLFDDEAPAEDPVVELDPEPAPEPSESREERVARAIFEAANPKGDWDAAPDKVVERFLGYAVAALDAE